MCKQYLSSRYWEISHNALGESDQVKHLYSDLIDLSIGDPDIDTPKEVIKGAFEDALNGHTHYTDFAGDPQFIEAIIEAYKEDYGISFDFDECMVTTSGCHAMWLVMEAILSEGDEVVIHAPYFPPYPDQIKMAKGKPVILETYEKDQFSIDLKKLKDLITPKTKAILINTPTNPTGACFSKDQLEGISQIAIDHDLLIIADDIYTAFSYDKPFYPINGIEGMKERTITIKSFSKDYCMSGWRLGYILAPSWLIECVRRINENNVFTAPSISQRGGIYALKNRKQITSEISKIFRERMDYAKQRLDKMPLIHGTQMSGSIYMFVNISRTGLTSSEFSDSLLNEKEVLVLPGDTFGQCGEGYVRIALTVSMGKLEKAFDRMDELMKQLDSKNREEAYV